jgi:competence protein ComEC
MADAFGVSLIEVSGDKSFSFGEITVDLLFGHTDAYSEDFNEACIVSLVKFGEFKALFTGDITAESERRMIDCYGLELSVSLMSVPHHGSNSSSCPEFIGVVDPEFSVISVGKNSYGEPDSSVISRLLDYGEVYNTMIHGAVEFVTDGVSIEVVE